MLSVVVRFVIKAGHDTSFLERMVQQSVETLRHEPECRQFDVCVDPSDSRRILLYETYTSEAAFGEHLVTSHFRSFDADTRDWVEEKTIERWSKVEPREPPSPQSGSGEPGRSGTPRPHDDGGREGKRMKGNGKGAPPVAARPPERSGALSAASDGVGGAGGAQARGEKR